MQYFTGTVVLREQDLAAGGYGFGWGHARVFTNGMTADFDRGQGWNWNVENWPYLVTSPHPGSTLALLGRSGTAWFRTEGDGTFLALHGAQSTLKHDVDAKEYTLAEPDGSLYRFNDLEHELRPGGFVSVASPGGLVTAVTDQSQGNLLAVSRSYVSGGVTVDEQFHYVFEDSGPHAGQLASVTLRRRADGGAWDLVLKAEYAYYVGSDAHGLPNDLKTVTRYEHDGTWRTLDTRYYRYWKADDAGGMKHGLRYVVGPEAYARLDAAVGDPLAAPDAVVAQYADYYFEYDDDRRVTKEITDGGSRTHTLDYHDNPAYVPADPPAPNAWFRRTAETRPDDSQVLVYCNAVGQTMLRVERDGADEWVEYNRFGEEGRPVLTASPSAVSGYDESLADLVGYDASTGAAAHLRAAAGLIDVTTYYDAEDGGAAAGLVKSIAVKNGTGGAPQPQREFEYAPHTAAGRTVRPVSKQTTYRGEAGSGPVSTTFSYTYHPGTVETASKVTHLPVVPEAQGGTGTADAVGDAFDVHGYRTWSRDARGFLTRWSYDVPTGAVVQRINDADVARVADAPAGWVTPAGGGLHLVTDFEHDARGRTTQTLGPEHDAVVGSVPRAVRAASWTVHEDATHKTVSAAGYRRTSDGSDVLVNPVSITQRDANGNVLEEIAAVRASTAGRPLPSDAYAQSDYVAWTTHFYTDCCKLSATRVYHTIPATGGGAAGANYDETTFGYDLRDRRNRTVSPGGTIAFTVFDVRSLPTAAYVGADDTGATAADPSGGGAGGNDMVLVSSNEYDGGTAGGDGNLTRTLAHVDAATARTTRFEYDWRNRRVATAGEEHAFVRRTLDNLGRVVRTERRVGSDAGRLLAKSETLRNDRGRTYRTLTYPVDPASGAAGTPAADRAWYDAAGNVIKSLPGGAETFSRSVYDGLGRATAEYVGFETGQTGLGSLAAATVLTQTETVHDAASNVLATTGRDRYDDATGTGPLGGPTGAGPNARVTYAAAWHDPVGRTTAAADYGTHGGAGLVRPDAVPARSDDALVSSTAYDDAGRTASATGPDGLTTAFAHDAAGRRTAVVENPAAPPPSSSGGAGCPASADQNRTTRFSYTPDGQLATLTAENADTGDQATTYEYGTTLADSGVASSSLLRRVRYPDSTGPTDAVILAYDRQGAATTVTDQNGTTHGYAYDGLGRRTADRVEALGAGVDGAARRVETAYDDRGLPVRLTTRDAAAGGGAAATEVTRSFDAWGRLTREFQSHAGAVDGSTPSVGYAHTDGADGTLRPTSLTYPDGRTLAYGYGAAGSADQAANRVAALTWDGTVVEEIDRLGSGAAAELRLPQPDVRRLWKLGGIDPDTGDAYGGWDRFGREVKTRWRQFPAATDLVSQDLGYDRASSRTRRRDLAAEAAGADRDELYGHDALRRLRTLARGDLNAAGDAVSGETFAQCWSLDATGNWRQFREGASSSVWDLEQTRAANAVNEIVGVAETAGPAWATPSYDPAGNMTSVPRPDDPTGTYAATYDAWNRLVRLSDGGAVVQQNAYDGRGFRISRTAGGETRHFYYSSDWRCLEERVGTSAAAERQFVWGTRYADELVLRDRDADGTGVLNERLYALQDANWNVAALADDAGAVRERYGYAAYGEPTVLTPAWGVRTGSDFDWETTYAGYRYDPAAGLYHVRHRTLHPRLGCWLTRDPVGYEGGKSLTAYMGSSPLAAADPAGLRPPSLSRYPREVVDPSAYDEERDGDWVVGFRKVLPPEPPGGRSSDDLTCLSPATPKPPPPPPPPPPSAWSRNWSRFKDELAEAWAGFKGAHVGAWNYDRFYGERWASGDTAVGQMVVGDIKGNHIYPAPGVSAHVTGRPGRDLQRRLLDIHSPAEITIMVGVDAVYLPNTGEIGILPFGGGGLGGSLSGGPTASGSLEIFGIYEAYEAADYDEDACVWSVSGGQGPYNIGYNSFEALKPNIRGNRYHGQGVEWSVFDPFGYKDPDLEADFMIQRTFDAGWRLQVVDPARVRRMPRDAAGNVIINPFQMFD